MKNEISNKSIQYVNYCLYIINLCTLHFIRLQIYHIVTIITK